MSERTEQISNPAVVTLSEMVAEYSAENVRLRQEIERLKALPAVVLYNPHPDTVLLDKLESEFSLDARYKTRFSVVVARAGGGIIRAKPACEAVGGPRTLREAIAALQGVDMKTSESQHLPGPWKRSPYGGPHACVVTADDMRTVCGIVYRDADAALIAAAPDLLEAAIEALAAINSYGMTHSKLVAAITKAKGGL